MGHAAAIIRGAALIAAGVMTTGVVAVGGAYLLSDRRVEAVVGGSSMDYRVISPCWCEMCGRQFDGLAVDIDSEADRNRRAMRRQSYIDVDGGGCNFTDERYRFWRIIEAGWPCRSFWGWKAEEVPALETEPPGRIERRRWIIDVPCNRERIAWNGSFEIPYAPLWPGLIANATIYATAWWALIAMPFALRRTFRRRRGHCPKCGYDCSASGDVCPECGQAADGEIRARRRPM